MSNSNILEQRRIQAKLERRNWKYATIASAFVFLGHLLANYPNHRNGLGVLGLLLLLTVNFEQLASLLSAYATTSSRSVDQVQRLAQATGLNFLIPLTFAALGAFL